MAEGDGGAVKGCGRGAEDEGRALGSGERARAAGGAGRGWRVGLQVPRVGGRGSGSGVRAAEGGGWGQRAGGRRTSLGSRRRGPRLRVGSRGEGEGPGPAAEGGSGPWGRSGAAGGPRAATASPRTRGLPHVPCGKMRPGRAGRAEAFGVPVTGAIGANDAGEPPERADDLAAPPRLKVLHE